MQRLQIGGVAVAGVLLMMSLYSMVLDRASNEVPVTQALDVERSSGASDKTETVETAQEPAVDLGVTPAPVNEAPAEVVGTEGQEADSGQIVPDLEPDPNLTQPMDQER